MRLVMRRLTAQMYLVIDRTRSVSRSWRRHKIYQYQTTGLHAAGQVVATLHQSHVEKETLRDFKLKAKADV